MNVKAGIVGAIAMLGCILAVWFAGCAHVQAQWDAEKRERQAQLEKDKAINKENNHAAELQHQKDLTRAKSEAGRAAVADYLRHHGMLSTGLKLPCSGRAEANCAKKPDGAAVQLGAGGSGVREAAGEEPAVVGFASDCAKDARQVQLFQRWVADEGMGVDQ